MKKVLYLRTNKDVRMMTDPYRLDIIQVFKKNGDRSFTVKEIADRLHEPHGKVYYHVKKLLDFGALRIDHTEKINGIIAKYYVLDFETIETFPKDDFKQDHTITMISKIFDDCKNDFLKTVRQSDAEQENTSEDLSGLKKVENDSFISMGSSFFTEENYWQFRNEMKELLEKYATEEKGISQVKKGVFVAVYSEVD